ncbi:TetR/AcrR family transcriptional regulator [Rhodopseudomonas palustris]|nr:TetR/AcrR family transcriptional regulator [Rhodopseudomonas palustris]ACE99306.1 putative transcriptional regulator, TetR family [Rhodopseudomonas palustris TIE-1]OPF94817.1 TetR family transcriptional regulator [Rhodopseudomonas palustris]PPQ45117.1 TetR/AcrR family transcriptional regulator [Rhodopseudomonas palustris]QLH73793.1 TetR/AcrR family transcriptional regulator [Rhodopseudomonas palustris]QQM02170.1 hypothetical protein I8G32_00695 [Rhodopseudomonas palustris]
MQLFAERGLTQISVTDLAQAAGVARGTVYNNLGDLTGLFDLVVTNLATELNPRLTVALADCHEPVQRLATWMRLLIRQAHEEPRLGRFVCRFGMSSTTLRVVWDGRPLDDLATGLAERGHSLSPEQIASAANFISGAVLGAIFTGLDGHRTWADAATETVEWVLVGLGVSREEARNLAAGDLPPLPE